MDSAKLAAARQNELMTELIELRPECPACGGAMTIRNGGGGEFWGCQGYPKCDRTKDLTTDVRERLDEGRRLTGVSGRAFRHP
jgi:ssDNA-binding Zn-finger/Zn-ribbon topoisomerase 1